MPEAKRQKNKKNKFIIFFIVLIVVGFFLLPSIIDVVGNSYNLHLFKKRIEALPHPDHSDPVTTHGRVGLLIGMSNHCDFFVGHIRSFVGNKAMIKKHYSNLTFLNPVTKNHEKCDVLFFEDFKAPDSYLPYEFQSLDSWQVKEHDLTKLYILSIFRSYDPNSDLRCR